MSGIKDGNFIGGDDLHSFLMIGQSNMAGRGDIADVEPINNFRCYMLRNGRFLRMSEPVNPDRAVLDKNFHSGISLAASFADDTAKHFNIKVGLIPCADGGTGIDEWQEGTILYDHAVFMAKLAMRTSKLAGIIWHQGENDCRSEEATLSHPEKFIKMMTSLRAELGAEDLPLIIGEIAEICEDRENRPKIINEQYHKIATQLPRTAVASAKGLTLKADNVHFDSVSLREFGHRYFEEYRKLTENI
jgi:hypothetical protein